MDTKEVIRYSRTGLTAASIAFSIISLFSEKRKVGSLIMALFCVSVSNLLSDLSCCDDDCCCDDDECCCGDEE